MVARQALHLTSQHLNYTSPWSLGIYSRKSIDEWVHDRAHIQINLLCFMERFFEPVGRFPVVRERTTVG